MALKDYFISKISFKILIILFQSVLGGRRKAQRLSHECGNRRGEAGMDKVSNPKHKPQSILRHISTKKEKSFSQELVKLILEKIIQYHSNKKTISLTIFSASSSKYIGIGNNTKEII